MASFLLTQGAEGLGFGDGVAAGVQGASLRHTENIRGLLATC